MIKPRSAHQNEAEQLSTKIKAKTHEEMLLWATLISLIRSQSNISSVFCSVVNTFDPRAVHFR